METQRKVADESNGDLSNTTTAQTLGRYYRELMTENIPGELVDKLVFDMGRELHAHGLKVRTADQ